VVADVSRAITGGAWWAPMLAFAAGVVSFASPCVLPLVPGYILMVTGSGAVAQEAGSGTAAQGSGGVATATTEHADRSMRAVLVPILLFVLGFSIVFTLLGGFAGSALSAWLRSDAGQRAAGVVVALFGVFMLLYAFRTRITWLYREERPLLSHVRPGPAGALPLGMAFAVGWTPCIGPVLAAILTLAAAQQGAARAAFLLFILGFSIVFTLLGGFAGSALSAWLRSDAGQRVAGAVVAVFGLFMLLYAFRTRITWLYREERPLLSHVRPGPAGALPLGMAFAVGWTPCIGPVLAAILTLAAAQQGAARAAFLLFMYSVGLGIPFVLVGLGVTRLMGAFRFVSRNYRWFAGISGVLLIALGVLLMTGLWTTLLSPILNDVNRYTPPI